MIYGHLWSNLPLDFVFRMKTKDWSLKVLVNNFMGTAWSTDLLLIKEVCSCLHQLTSCSTVEMLIKLFFSRYTKLICKLVCTLQCKKNQPHSVFNVCLLFIYLYFVIKLKLTIIVNLFQFIHRTQRK